MIENRRRECDNARRVIPPHHDPEDRLSIRLFAGIGGSLVLPDQGATLASAPDGGNLVVNTPRVVWERSELTAPELVQWAFLVAAAGRAMLEALPQLDGGCINY